MLRSVSLHRIIYTIGYRVYTFSNILHGNCSACAIPTDAYYTVTKYGSGATLREKGLMSVYLAWRYISQRCVVVVACQDPDAQL